jgi:ribosomal protein L24E
MLVKKFMWDCKQRFSLPNIENAKIFIQEEVKIMRYCSKKARKIFLNSEIEVLQG